MKTFRFYLLSILMLLLASTSVMAQQAKNSSPKLDSLNRVLASLEVKGSNLNDKYVQNDLALQLCKTDAEINAKIAERKAIEREADKNCRQISKVQQEIEFENARIEQEKREAKYARQQQIRQASNPRATRGVLNGHEWVDLGLPSGTKWAACNVGARKPHERGWHLAFGETKPRKNYYEYTWKYYQHTNKNLGNIAGNATYDAATANMGAGWQMPSREQWEELRKHCDWQFTIQDGVRGSLYVSRINANYIFLPVTGYTDDDKGKLIHTTYNGAYWSCKGLYPDGAEAYIFNYEIEYPSTGIACSAHAVRGVCYAQGELKSNAEQPVQTAEPVETAEPIKTTEAAQASQASQVAEATQPAESTEVAEVAENDVKPKKRKITGQEVVETTAEVARQAAQTKANIDKTISVIKAFRSLIRR